ncbi:unnamed protein product [Symbiodinium sp. CCMP2592]|nr:unnamed protein product [Symbiodinium sp. CCMP2592]
MLKQEPLVAMFVFRLPSQARGSKLELEVRKRQRGTLGTFELWDQLSLQRWDPGSPLGFIFLYRSLIFSDGVTSYQGSTGFQLPWAAIPKFIPGTTDVTEYSRKREFLAAMWPKEHLSLLAPRAALQVEGTAFKKIASLPPDKLKSNDESGIKLLVSTLGGSWGKTDLEAKYDVFEKALYGTVQKQDETNDSYLARHDVHFEELLAQSVTFEQVRAYILLRQSQLTAEDRKKIILELGGSLDYKRVCSSIRLLGSRFFADLQGQRVLKSRTYDANVAEEPPPEEGDRTLPTMMASAAIEEAEVELDDGFIEAMVATEDQDALQVQAFEEELENFFQDTPELQEALVSYMEARGRLLAKKKSRGFWPIGGSKGASKGGRGFKGGGKGKGKHREQLLARIARSNCRICGERGHWKAECPRRKSNPTGEATTTVAEAFVDVSNLASSSDPAASQEILTSLPADALTLEEALCVNPDLPSKTVASLGARLLRLRDPASNLSMAEVEELSLEKHGAFLIDFGTKMKGRSYLECVEEAADWTKWFVEHYHDSSKRNHRIFLSFVENYVSQAEQIEVALSGEPTVVMTGASSKAPIASKAAPKALPKAGNPEVPWELLEDPPIHDQVASLSNRMVQMEQESENSAKQLMQSQPTLPKLRAFLKTVPWHLFANPNARASVVNGNSEDGAMSPNLEGWAPPPVPIHGRIERHGDIVKSMLSRLDKETPITSDSSLDQALQQVFNAKNALVRHKGYAPEQIVLGKSVRVPGSVSSDEELSSHSLTEGADLEAEVICQEGQSVVWVAHGSTILRCAPENLRPASLREWQSLSSNQSDELSTRTGGASTFVDLTAPNPEITVGVPTQPAPSSSVSPIEVAVPAPVPQSGSSAAQGSGESEADLGQPEQELTPQVSIQTELPASLDAPEVERDTAAPSAPMQPTPESNPSALLDATAIPVPGTDEGLFSETVLLATNPLDTLDPVCDDLMEFTTLHTSAEFEGPPLAEDNLPFVEKPLECSEHQAFCLDVPIKPKDLKRWAQEAAPEQLATLAAVSKRARAEVSVKDLSPQEMKLFEQAKAKELQCWVQTSAIRSVLRRRLNPEQILRSRWILTWKTPEPGNEGCPDFV